MGAYADLESLIALQYKVGGFALQHSQPVRNLIFGRRSSHVRGRGLDFEELRGYVMGDDVRSMDWRVTARMQKPYVRVYSEERDRPSMLVVDQRINMFFGSALSMKSVAAAEASALTAWRLLRQGDRIGAFVFNDTMIEEVSMRRSRAAVLRILNGIVQQNKMLRADLPVKSNAAQLNAVLDRVARVCTHSSLVMIASDFDGADEQTHDLLMRLSRANDVLCCLIYDPLAMQLPITDQLVAGDGELQIELQMGRESVRNKLQTASKERMNAILNWQHQLGVPVFPLSAAQDVGQQIGHLLGHLSQRRRRL